MIVIVVVKSLLYTELYMLFDNIINRFLTRKTYNSIAYQKFV